ncbi:MAG TPA: MarR family winged helix-turn-helix transcriptional regulator [Jatrophihabitans sp.]|nr:MarR family winged helix-turn-helix transcriptional regulator [Jatrophihabitans sp.]
MAQQLDIDDVARLRIALARISRAVDRMSNEAGFTRTQLSVLGTVARLKSVGMGELAEIEGLNPTMLSRVVGQLEDAGLITRGSDEADRRSVRVGLTAAGRSLQLKLRKRRTEVFARQLGALPAGQAADLLDALPAMEALADQMHAGLRSQRTAPLEAASVPGRRATPLGAAR